MENHPFSIQNVLSKIKTFTQDLWHLLPLKDNAAKSSIHNIGWNPPPPNFFKLNTDGSARGGPGLASAEGLIRDHNGSWIASFNRNIDLAHSLVAELWGLRDGLALAKDLNIKNLIIEVDAQVVVSIIKSHDDSSIASYPYSGLMLNCRSLLRLFDDVQLCHIHREANFYADLLAKEGYNNSFPFILHPHPPLCILYQLMADAWGTRYPRLCIP